MYFLSVSPHDENDPSRGLRDAIYKTLLTIGNAMIAASSPQKAAFLFSSVATAGSAASELVEITYIKEGDKVKITGYVPARDLEIFETIHDFAKITSESVLGALLADLLKFGALGGLVTSVVGRLALLGTLFVGGVWAGTSIYHLADRFPEFFDNLFGQPRVGQFYFEDGSASSYFIYDPVGDGPTPILVDYFIRQAIDVVGVSRLPLSGGQLRIADAINQTPRETYDIYTLDPLEDYFSRTEFGITAILQRIENQRSANRVVFAEKYQPTPTDPLAVSASYYLYEQSNKSIELWVPTEVNSRIAWLPISAAFSTRPIDATESTTRLFGRTSEADAHAALLIVENTIGGRFYDFDTRSDLNQSAPTNGAAVSGFADRANITLAQNETIPLKIHGGNRHDIVLGGKSADTVFGYAGADTIYGGEGTDELFGGIGDDLLDGGTGADTLVGSHGNDVLHGNGAFDTIVLEDNFGIDIVREAEQVLFEGKIVTGRERGLQFYSDESGLVITRGDSKIFLTDWTPHNDYGINPRLLSTVPGIYMQLNDWRNYSTLNLLTNDRDVWIDNSFRHSPTEGKITIIQDTIYGFGGDDAIVLSGGGDFVDSGSGNDDVSRRDNWFLATHNPEPFLNDAVYLGSGDDRGNDLRGLVSGGDGDDSISGIFDAIDGGSGDDTIAGTFLAGGLHQAGDGDDFILPQMFYFTDYSRIITDTYDIELRVSLLNPGPNVILDGGAGFDILSLPHDFNVDNPLATVRINNQEFAGRDHATLEALATRVDVSQGLVESDYFYRYWLPDGNPLTRPAIFVGTAQYVFQDFEAVITGEGDTTIRGSAERSMFIETGRGNDLIYAGGRDTVLFGESPSGNDTLISGGAYDRIRFPVNPNHEVPFGPASHINNSTPLEGLARYSEILGYWQLGSVAIAPVSDGLLLTSLIAAANSSTLLIKGWNTTVSGNFGIILGPAPDTSINPTDTIIGSALNDTLSASIKPTEIRGLAGNDFLTGSSNADTIYGDGGNDTIDGGAGADFLCGGQGNDIYIVRSALATIVDNAQSLSNSGIDRIIASVDYALNIGEMSDLEELYLVGAARRGTGNLQANVIVGTVGSDTLDGMESADTLIGGRGADFYYVRDPDDIVIERPRSGTDTVFSNINWTLAAHTEILVLLDAANIGGIGNALGNTIIGNDAANDLAGLRGADTLIGGAGNDIYRAERFDTVVEVAGEGADTVISGGSFNLGFAPNVEVLQLLGTLDSNGTGNDENNLILGNTGNNRLEGGAGADTLLGGRGNDMLLGDDGDDSLFGGIGADRLFGGAGNDIFQVTDAANQASDVLNGGIDLVLASVTFALGSHIENLTLTGNAAINGTGNLLANVITGNNAANTLGGGAGADTLIGGGGADTLTGGTGSDVLTGGVGADTFRYESLAERGDIITDFASGLDKVAITAAGLGGSFVPGTLAAGRFVSHASDVATATSGTGQFVYNSGTGLLSFDADGLDGAAALGIATLVTRPALTASDFILL